MTAQGLKYRKRPCRGCGQPTTTRFQIRLREVDLGTRRDGKTLASRTVTLCDTCGFGLYAFCENQVDDVERAVA